MADIFDDDAQPLEHGFNWQRRVDRGTDELVGICRGVLADGALVLDETIFLLHWLERNAPVRETPPGQQIYDALSIALKDGRLDPDKEDELVKLFLRFTGGTPTKLPDASYSTSLPMDDPPPTVVVADAGFCFTGKFVFGTRSECEAAVLAAGGLIHKNPKKDTRFLVIGEIGSRDWVHSNSGRKIEIAVALRSDGNPVSIISEEWWRKALGLDQEQ